MRGTLGVPGQAEHQTGGKGSSVGCAGAHVVNADRAWVPQSAVIVDVTGAQHSYWRLSDGGSVVVLLGLWEPTTPTFRASLAGAAVITKPQTILIEIRAGRQMAEKPA